MAYENRTKRQKQALRELAGIAYRREQASLLSDLAAQFDEWRNGDIDQEQLVQAIHEFHDGAARQLYKLHRYLDAEKCITIAVSNQIVAPVEVPADLREEILEMARARNEL